MTEASTYLLEIDAHNSDLEDLTLYVSSSGYRTGVIDAPADTEYPAKIVNPGFLDRSLFTGGRTMGQSEVSYGEIELVNQNGELDSWFDLGVDGHLITLKRLVSPRAAYNTAELLLRASMTRMDSTQIWNELRIRLYDRRLLLDKPLQINRYAGTTLSAGATAEGTADKRGQPKPLCYGTVLNVPAVVVNPFNLFFQVHDGPVSNIVVYDGGVPLTATSTPDYANLAALHAATVPAGKYATCKALGLFKLGASPYKVITADVTEGSTLALRNAAQVALRILTKMGLNSSEYVNVATFTALAAAAPAEVGVFVNGDTTCLETISQVLGSIGAYLVPSRLGVFEVGRLSAPGTPVWEIDERYIHAEDGDIGLVANPDTEGGVPAWRVILRHRRVWQVQDDSAVARACTAVRRGLVGSEYRESISDNTATRQMHLNAPELTIDTLLVNAADADAEALRRKNLYSVRRDVLSFPVRGDDADTMTLGSSGTLTLPRLGYESGRDMVVIGRREDYAREMVEITLWG